MGRKGRGNKIPGREMLVGRKGRVRKRKKGEQSGDILQTREQKGEGRKRRWGGKGAREEGKGERKRELVERV